MKTGTRSAKAFVDRHGGVLEADGAVGHHHDGFAFDLGEAVGHGDGGFLVAAGEEFRGAVAAVVDDRFVERAEGGAGVGADVLDAEGLDDIDHEVGAGAFVEEDFAGEAEAGFSEEAALFSEEARASAVPLRAAGAGSWARAGTASTARAAVPAAAALRKPRAGWSSSHREKAIRKRRAITLPAVSAHGRPT